MEIFTTQAALKPMTTPVGIAICAAVFVIFGGVAAVEQILNMRGVKSMNADNKGENEALCACNCCVKRDVCCQAEAVRKFQSQLLCADVNEFCGDFGVKVKVECTKYVRDKVHQNEH
jgi:hypothetical protein